MCVALLQIVNIHQVAFGATDVSSEKQPMTSNQNKPNVPSNAEVIATFERLLLQANSAKASTWSVRTLDRALGWAILAEKAKPGSETNKAQTALTKALLENSFTTDTVKEKCTELLKQWNEDFVLSELAIKAAEANKFCKQAQQQLKKLDLGETEILDRIMAKEILAKCRNSEEDRSYVMNHMAKNFNEAWANVLCWMIIFSLPSDRWVHELFKTLNSSIQQICKPSLESRARTKLVTNFS